VTFSRDENSSLHYVVRGFGEPFLLIHGFGGSGAALALQVAALEKRFRVIVPSPRDEYTIDDFAATLCAGPLALNISQRAVRRRTGVRHRTNRCAAPRGPCFHAPCKLR